MNPSTPEAWPDGEGPVRIGPEDTSGEGPLAALIVDVAGFEGPLDLLLQLARTQKVDLARISMLELANQYLAFIAELHKMRLEVAADYLVMAAWLAWLKSRLLAPVPRVADEPEPEDMVRRLAFRLKRLQAMRDAASRLMTRDRMGLDVFGRGAPESVELASRPIYGDTLVDLLRAYAQRRAQSGRRQTYRVQRQPTWSIKDAREILERLFGVPGDWGSLNVWLEQYLADPVMRPSVIASSFTASLELAREGMIEMRQEAAFAPIYMRSKS